jgi:hypothetical protein
MKSLLLFVFFMSTIALQAQFLQFSVFVDTEVSAQTVQELDFGTMLQNNEVMIGLDESGSGWFQVAVLNVSDVQLFLDAPQQLVLENEGIICGNEPCSVGLELGFAYYIDSTPRLQIGQAMRPLSEGFNEISVARASSSSTEPEYIYININIFGTLSVGDVPSGIYTGTMNLEVNY